MSEKRFLHCREIHTDATSRMNQVEHLPDGRLFTMASFCKSNSGGRFSKLPVSQYVMGRVSEDEERSYPVLFRPDRTLFHQMELCVVVAHNTFAKILSHRMSTTRV